jgi:hypothetical protein
MSSPDELLAVITQKMCDRYLTQITTFVNRNLHIFCFSNQEVKLELKVIPPLKQPHPFTATLVQKPIKRRTETDIVGGTKTAHGLQFATMYELQCIKETGQEKAKIEPFLAHLELKWKDVVYVQALMVCTTTIGVYSFSAFLWCINSFSLEPFHRMLKNYPTESMLNLLPYYFETFTHLEDKRKRKRNHDKPWKTYNLNALAAPSSVQ